MLALYFVGILLALAHQARSCANGGQVNNTEVKRAITICPRCSLGYHLTDNGECKGEWLAPLPQGLSVAVDRVSHLSHFFQLVLMVRLTCVPLDRTGVADLVLATL